MADLVTIAQSDSTNDGSGASTILEPPQVDNATDDAILIKVTQSLNNATNVSNINVTTPTGYTLLRDLRDVEIRSWVFYKQSTGSETIPTVTSDTSAKWTCTTAVVTDVDWVNGGVTQQVSATGGGDQQSPDLTTDSNGAASAIICFYSLERRSVLGFKYPQTRPETVYAGTVNTGGAEGVDNASGAGYDFITDRNTVWEGPLWDANGGGDSLAINVEVLVQGNIIPLQSSTFVTQGAPANTFQTNMNWCREIINSGKDLDGNTLDTWTFDASTANTGTNSVTVTGHSMDESMVVYLETNGNTAPTGLANDTFYYVDPISANEIRFRSVNEDTDATSDYYADGTSKRPIVGISATGTGTITLTEARMINAGANVLDVFRPNAGDSANVGSFSGNYIGDGGYNQNFVGTSQRFNSVFDATSETITFDLQVSGVNRINRVLMTLIDEDGDWINWKLYQRPNSPNNTGQRIYQFQVDQTSVKALKYQEQGTFDHTRIRYLVISGRGNNLSTNRFGAINSASSLVNLGGPFTVVGGQNASFTKLVSLASTYTTSITKPSDLQIVSTIPIAIGDGTTDISFVDSEKSIAFPPLADGVNTFQNYLDALGIEINATSSSTVKLTNSQIGASVPYNFDVTAASGATIDLTGNSYVFGTASLDVDATYNRQLFVGGEGVTDNGAEIRNSTFIVNSQLGSDKGIIDWGSNTNIQSSAFELASGTNSGHAIKITDVGTYTFTNLTFNNFGSDGTNTAAIFNDSGGSVTIISDNPTTPTARNGVGATTVIQQPSQPISITNISAGSRIQIFNSTTSTEIVNQVVSGTSYTEQYQEGANYSQGDLLTIRVAQQTGATAKLPYETQVIVGASGWSLLVSQEDDVIYNQIGIDGSTVTKFEADYQNNEIDIIVESDFTGIELYSRFVFFTTTEEGIRDFFKAFNPLDIANYENDVSILNLYLNNNTTTNIKQIDNVRLFKSDGSYPVREPTTGGGGIDVNWRNIVYPVGLGDLENKIQNLVDSENADIFVTPTRFTKKKEGTNTVLLEKTYTTDGQGTESLTEET